MLPANEGVLPRGTILHSLLHSRALSLFSVVLVTLWHTSLREVFYLKKITTKSVVLMGVLAALSIVFTRLLSIPIGDSIRISLGGLPIILAGIWLGPFAGGIVGAVADFLGATVLSGLGFYLPLMLGPVLLGVFPGLLRGFARPESGFLSQGTVVLISEVIASVIWNSLALSWLIKQPYAGVLIARLPFSLIMTAANIILVYFINKRLGGRFTEGIK